MAVETLPFAALSVGVALEAAALALAFVGVLFVGSIVVPGPRISGPDITGASRTYKLNGFSLFLVVVAVAALGQALGWFSLAVLHSHFLALFLVANVFAFALSGWLYVRGARRGAPRSGFWHDIFMGVEAGPTAFGVDLKLFSYRPSLIGLALLNASFGVVQYEIYGALTPAMMLYLIFTFVYVFNYFQFESGMVHTWDMVSERFGWMLVWGDYAFVPFFYSLPGWWLVDASGPESPFAIAAIAALFVFGFWLFRGANEQKHSFKQNPEATIWGRPAKTIDGRLLVSGFWGIGRHLNYTGEICIYLAFALTTGFASWVPYILPAWLIVLLWHRSVRDDRRCRAKYGELWERYTERVRYSLVPFVY